MSGLLEMNAGDNVVPIRPANVIDLGAIRGSRTETAISSKSDTFSGDCINILDLDGRLLAMSDAGIRLMEVDDFASFRGRSWTSLWNGDGSGAAADAVEAARVGGTGRFRASGTTAWGTPKQWEVQVTAIPDETGNPKHLLAILRDTSEEQKAEEHRRYLVGELEHRIKNTLAIASSIVSQTFRTSTSMEEALDKVMGRFSALGHAHDILTRTTWTNALIKDVIEAALEPHMAGEGRFRLSGPDLDLSAKQALSLSLAIYELATNAAKYGALCGTLGHVEVSWSVKHLDEAETFRFDWREVGGPPVTKPARQGFGLRLIERILANDFAGLVQIEFAPSGVHCSVTSSGRPLPFGFSG